MKKILFLLAFVFASATVSMAQYKVGDYYEKDGVKGIVVRVDATGEHGLIMSLDKCAKKWLKDKDAKFNTNAFHEDDGEKNMAVIEEYLKENGQTWEIFPYFEWCKSLGEGWYAPAADELRDILKMINGGEGKYNAKHMKKINKLIKKNKGDGLINSGYMGSNCPQSMYSSTESDGGMVYTLYFKENMSSALLRRDFAFGLVKSKPKGEFVVESVLKTYTGGKFANAFGSRAVKKF